MKDGHSGSPEKDRVDDLPSQTVGETEAGEVKGGTFAGIDALIAVTQMKTDNANNPDPPAKK